LCLLEVCSNVIGELTLQAQDDCRLRFLPSASQSIPQGYG